MDNYSLGRQSNVGLGKETVYGTTVAPTIWIPFQEFTVSDQKVTITDNSGVGTRDDVLAIDVDHYLSQGNLNGLIYANEFRYIVHAAFGAVNRTAHSTATGVSIDSFTPANTLPSYTIAAEDLNEDVRFGGALCNEFTINGATGAYANFTSTWLGRKSAGSSNTPAVSDGQIRFRPKDITIKYAETVDDLDEADAKPFQQFSLTCSNNIQTVAQLGTEDPAFVQGIFSASLTLNKSYFNTEFKDLVFGIDKMAVQISMTRSDILIGSAVDDEDNTNPSVVITFEPGYFAEWGKEGGLDDLRTESITFQPSRNFGNGKNITIDVTSTGAAV